MSMSSWSIASINTVSTMRYQVARQDFGAADRIAIRHICVHRKCPCIVGEVTATMLMPSASCWLMVRSALNLSSEG